MEQRAAIKKIGRATDGATSSKVSSIYPRSYQQLHLNVILPSNTLNRCILN